jgi:hypothetical protein
VTDYPAAASKDTLVAFPLAGRTSGFAYPPPSTARLDLHTIGATDPTPEALWAAGGVADPPVAPVDRIAVRDPRASVAANWFDRVHGIPRELDFGNIITPVTKRFEVHNASDAPVTITAITNNPQLGISLPDTVAPHVLGAHASTLDPSASLSLAPAGARAIAGAVGAAFFDEPLVFFTALNLVEIGVTGSRTVVLFSPWESGTEEWLEWLTPIIEAQDATEQRISARSFPRQGFNVRWQLEGAERRRMNLLVEQLHGASVGMSVWTEQVALTVAASATQTVLTVDSTNDVDLRVGELAIVYGGPGTFDVQRVTAKTATTITLEAGLLNSYPVGTPVMPLRLGLLAPSVSGARYPTTVQDMATRFTVTDNHTGAPTGSTAGWSALDGKVFLDDFNFVDVAMQEARERRLLLLDNETGIQGHTSRWARDRRRQSKRWHTKTRAELMKLRRLLLALRGQQVSFKVPTFAEDLVVTQTLSSGANTMVIENVAFSRYVVSGRQFRITFTDGSKLVRTVTASSELSATEEQLTLNDTWPSTKLASEVVRVEFVETCRFASDRITIQHGAHVGKATVEVPVRQLKE